MSMEAIEKSGRGETRPSRACRYILPVVALAGVFSSLAALGDSAGGGCVVASGAGAIETRDGHAVATPAGVIDASQGPGLVILVR